MILTDANLLLYAYNKSASQHRIARAWLEAALSLPELFGFSWPTIAAFIRITTNPRAFPHPFSLAEAAAAVSAWLACPMVRLLTPGDRHWQILQDLLVAGQANGPLVMDAHLAALAIEHGATLCTTDRDFHRFPDLKLMNPLSDRRIV